MIDPHNIKLISCFIESLMSFLSALSSSVQKYSLKFDDKPIYQNKHRYVEFLTLSTSNSFNFKFNFTGELKQNYHTVLNDKESSWDN